MTSAFTSQIISTIERNFHDRGDVIFKLSPLIQYIDYKTKSANRGSKSRGSFANLYAIYVLVEDYITGGYCNSGNYSSYVGADFSALLKRIRNLPFGAKLQNHALNNRANDEFHKYFPSDERRPIIRNVETQKYWITESLLKVKVGNDIYNIADTIIQIIDLYVETKRESFNRFILNCEKIRESGDQHDSIGLIKSLLAPEQDARLFEIVSFAILKTYYSNDIIFIGQSRETVEEECLKLYKTGRTNANDGGIDFVMRPLGRFFQVTETLDVKKYFLDIDKVEHFPISFVVKTTIPNDEILRKLRDGAIQQYGIADVVKKYMDSIEQVYNIPSLLEIYDTLVISGRDFEVFDEVVKWSKIEFNIDDSIVDESSVADEDEDI